jgi:predicted acyltransferase
MVTETKKVTKERLYSLDTLRGFDMFWIIGGGTFLGTLAKATEWGWVEVLAKQMHHVPWEGFQFEDLIFPLFMFISGVAIPFALTSRIEKGVEKSVLYRKVFKRMVLLIILGFIYNGTLKNGFVNMRWPSVLSQIGIAYFAASVIIMNTKNLKERLFWLVGILLSITVLQLIVPVPGFGASVLTPEGSINAWIDQLILPGKLIYGTYDPEGVLSIVSATSITILGGIAGFVLRDKSQSQIKKVKILTVTGLSLVVLALLLSPVYPIIKNIWTAPFNILTSGISFLLMALFYYIIDVKMWRGWILFFKVIGLNSILIYMGRKLLNFDHTSQYLLGFMATPLGDYGPVILTVGTIGLEFILLYYLYKKKIFLRV